MPLDRSLGSKYCGEAPVVLSVLDGAFRGLSPGEEASLSNADEKRSGSPGDRMRCLIMRQYRKGTCTAHQAVSLLNERV
jgi:hypothetical protein